MNVKSMLQMPAIKDWLEFATSELASNSIPTPKLDAEIILANILNVDRTYLHAHPEQIIYPKQYILLNRKLRLRLKRTPIAYITGKKEFYGRQFVVDKNVLIPRPESEAIIEILKSIIHNLQSTKIINLVDVGTGSGCLGITAKLELPNLDVTLLDISSKALKIANKNAKSLSADVKIKKNDLLKSYHNKIDIIVANLPYVDKSWERSPETQHEPALALFATDNGQSIIKQLIVQASNLLSSNGYLIIESDPDQHKSLIEYAKKSKFENIDNNGYILAFKLLDGTNTNTVKS